MFVIMSGDFELLLNNFILYQEDSFSGWVVNLSLNIINFLNYNYKIKKIKLSFQEIVQVNLEEV